MKGSKKAPFKTLIVRFGCDNCGRRWRSASGNMNDFQICKNCYQKVYPCGYQYEAPNKRGNQNRETFESHNSELCGKCIRLGFNCMELTISQRLDQDAIEELVPTIVRNEDEEDIALTNNVDILAFIKPQKTKNKNKKKMSTQQTKHEHNTLDCQQSEEIISRMKLPLSRAFDAHEDGIVLVEEQHISILKKEKSSNNSTDSITAAPLNTVINVTTNTDNSINTVFNAWADWPTDKNSVNHDSDSNDSNEVAVEQGCNS
ncbi:hypothetical protein BDF20DRAFT_831284 [Mycotypha africana]|uniref:uncharacterized protein n=1 Tax=Mycotypha africana TaxID=64632 RepID=UPI0023013241|nr:uncharacterized protein BDF20DRAFT_831284 [Mycotypha africana]KAI8991224.1 hypothetical protein BDF20DRAFT_831284 [Mycotypha africana]